MIESMSTLFKSCVVFSGRFIVLSGLVVDAEEDAICLLTSFLFGVKHHSSCMCLVRYGESRFCSCSIWIIDVRLLISKVALQTSDGC